MTHFSNPSKDSQDLNNLVNFSKKKSFFNPIVQPKLSINQPNDVYEQEADAMADKVMRMPDSLANNNSFFKPSTIQRKCAHCEEDDKMAQRKETNNDVTAASTQTEDYINTLSGGKPLSKNERSFFEPRMGYDFSDVKIHTDTDATKSARSINALAYTTGNSIVFNENQFSPETEPGKKILAHELTHVVQQSNNSFIQRTPNPPGWDELHNYKHPGSVVVRFTHFKTANATSDPFNDYAAKAKTLLQQHNLGMAVVEGGEINFQTPLQDLDDVKNLRMEAHKKFQDTTPRLPVISAVYSSVKGFDASNLNGQTVKNTDWLPFVILNSSNKSTDNVTLLHETGHAANVPGNVDLPVRPNDTVQNFMLYGANRTDMLKQQVIAIANAYFSK